MKKSPTQAINASQSIVSIITIVFNNSKYIKEAIESVLSQDYDSIEYIIIDGGSVDGTIEIINEYRDKISTFISEPDNGVYHAINKGISFATGDIVSILHSDDVFNNKNVVSRMVDEMINSCSEFCFSDMIIVNKDSGAVLRFYMASYFHRWMLRTGWMPPHPTCFIKKSLFYEFGMYSESYKVAGDFEFFVRIFYSREINWNYVNIISIKMRSGGLSNSGFKSKLLTSREITKSLKQNNIWAPRYFQILRYLIRLIELITPKFKTFYS
jgi:glycosyltransferase involved in cell wall biosynthesis